MSLDDAQLDVEWFHLKVLDRASPPTPAFRDAGFRLRLLLEEVAEFAEASGFMAVASEVRSAMPLTHGNPTWSRQDFPAACDGLIDTIYIAIGTMSDWGVDAAPLWGAVQRANMAKVGGGRNAEGKVMKPPGWQPPNIEGELVKQGWKP